MAGSGGHDGAGEAEAAQPIDDGRPGRHRGRPVPAASCNRTIGPGRAAASSRWASWSAVTFGGQSAGSTLHSTVRSPSSWAAAVTAGGFRPRPVAGTHRVDPRGCRLRRAWVIWSRMWAAGSWSKGWGGGRGGCRMPSRRPARPGPGRGSAGLGGRPPRRWPGPCAGEDGQELGGAVGPGAVVEGQCHRQRPCGALGEHAVGDRQQIPGRWELKAFQGLRHVRPAGSGLERPSTITVTDDHS